MPPLPDGAEMDADAAPQAPLPASVAPSIQGFTADDVSREVADAAKAARNARLKFAFEEARKVTEDASVETVAIAKQLNVPFNTVRENLPALRETAAAAQWDPDKWAADNPELSRLITTNPHLGTLVMRSPEVGPIVKAWRATTDIFEDARQWYLRQEDVDRRQFQADMNLGHLELKPHASTPEEIAGERAERDTPKPEQRRVDSISREAQEKTGLDYLSMFAWQKGLEAKRHLDISYKQADLMLAENGISGDAAELRAEIHDLKLEAIPRDLGGETGLLRDLAEGIEGAASTLVLGADAVKGAGIVGGAGLVVGAATTFAITRHPGAAARAGIGLARAAGGKGASVAVFLSAVKMETGASYEALGEEVTDQGQKLTPAEKMGGAIIQGIAKGSLESLSFGQSSKVLKAALPNNITGLLKTNPTFRAHVANVAKEYAKSIVTEGVTEALQDAVEQVATYIQESMKDGVLQAGDVIDTDRSAQAFQGGVFGAILSGGVTSSISIAVTKTKDAQAEVGDRQVGPLLDLAQQPAVRAASDEFAQMVADEGGAKSLHVDASAVVRFFQDKGDDGAAANAAVAELLGPEAPAALLEAVVSGGKLEVPMAKVLATWGASDIGKALKDDTTTDATGLTPRQRKEQAAEIEAAAEEIAQAEEARATEEQLLATRTAEVEQQQVAAGLGKQEAKGVAGLVRAYMATMQADFNKALSVVLPETPVSFAKGDETATATERLAQKPVVDFLQERFDAQDVATPEGLDQRQRDFFIDSTTGVWNSRAWKRIEERGVESVGSISIEGIKFSNDKQGGHQAGDAVYAAAAQALAPHLPGVAKVGGDFAAADVSQADLDAALEKANADPRLQGYRLSGLVAGPKGKLTALRHAVELHNKAKAEAEKSGKRAARGSKPLGAKEGKLALTEKPVSGREIADFLKEAHAKLDPKEAFRETYFEDTGLLNKDGRDTYLREHPQKFHATLDLNLLKAYNDILGDDAGDQFIAAFGKAMAEAGADQFVGTHVSGDEYTLDGNDAGALASFIAHLRGVLENATIKVTSEQGVVVHVPGISFGAGIAESIDAAEAQLNADKERLAVEGKRGRDSAASRLIAEANLARGLREATAADGRQGGVAGVDGAADSAVDASSESAAAPVEGRADGSDAEVAGGLDADEQLALDTIAVREERGDLRAEEVQAIEQGFNRTEDVARAREAVEAFRAAPKKAPASEAKKSKKERNAAVKAREVAAQVRLKERIKATQAFLEWVENLGPGLQEPGQAFKREGAVEASKELIREVELWARNNFNLLDPAHGVSDFHQASGIAAIPDDMRREKKPQAKGVAAQEAKRDARLAFEKNVLGRVNQEVTRLNQDKTGPKWFSAAEEAAKAAKQEKNSPGAWWSVISKTPGVKAEELELLGLKKWLDEQKGSLTRDQVAAFIASNRVEVTEKSGADVAGELAERTRDAIAEAETAATAWTGLDWDSGINFETEHGVEFEFTFDGSNAETLASDIESADAAVEAAKEAVDDDAEVDVDEVAAEAMGSPYGKLVRKYGLEEVRKLSEMATEEAQDVEGRADKARDHGRDAVRYLKEGDYSSAAESARRASSEERHYGDNPAWRRFEDLTTQLAEDADGAGGNQYEDYKLGGEEAGSYQELRFYTPRAAGFEAPHFDKGGKGLLAHARVSIHRDATGERVLFVEEIQSDLHQQGRDEGYGKKVPDAPFKQSWEELVAKRMLMLAAEKGIKKIGWTTGAQQADRFDLGKRMESLRYQKNPDGTYKVKAVVSSSQVETLGEAVSESELAGMVGKDVAKRIVASEGEQLGFDVDDAGEPIDVWGVLRGGDLRVGVEGMHAAYDVRLPSVFKKLVKSSGGTVQQEKLELGPATNEEDQGQGSTPTVWTATVPESLLAAVGEKGLALFQDDGAIPKGYTELPAGRALQKAIRIFLNKSADVSTAIHELGHAFLEQTFDLSERPDAPQRTKDTAAAALAALGVTKRSEVKREHHEKFARSFEAYAMKGKAPSNALRKVFAKFQRWLTAIYRTLRNIPGNEISPELRQVFDAMLATEDQLAAMRKKEGPSAKVTEEQAEQTADDYTEGSMRAQLAAIKDALRVRESWWKKGHAQVSKSFEAEYEALPARRAQLLLIENEIVLDRKAVESVIGTAKFPGLRTAEEGGTFPSTVAELAGYKSPRAMLADLAGLRSKETWAKAQADAEMRRLHPGILDDLTKFRRMLSDGLRSATEQRLSREWRGLPKEALKRAAEKLAERREVTKLRPDRALARQRAQANAKARFAAKGDITKATEAAKAELLNHYLFHALRDAEQEVEKLHALAKSLTKTSARERLGKASPAYRDASAFILSALGVGEDRPDLDAGAVSAVVAQMNGDAVLIGDPEWLSPVLRAGTFETLTVEQARHVFAALKNIKTAANHRTTILVGGKRIDKEQAIGELLAEAEANKRPAPAVGSRALGAVIRRVGSTFSAPLLKIETMVGWLGGNLVGKDERASAWHRYVYRVLEGARQRESDLQGAIAKPVLDALEAMPAAMKRRMGEGFDGAAAFPQHGIPGSRQKLEAPSRRHEVLAMALNAGNQSNLDRLLGGRSITEEQLLKALNELTKEEIDWVNSVHAAFEASWPEIQAMEERLTGLKPKGVEKRSMALKNGTISGGYFPALYDPRIAGVGATQLENSIAEMFGPTFGRPGTAHGHTQGRVEGFVGPISLNLNAIPIHLAQHVHDLAFREPIISVAGLVLDKRVQDSLFASLGPERAKQFKPWVSDAARVQGIEGAETAGWGLQVISKLRGNISVAALGYSVPNAIEDFSGIPAALADRELKPGAWAKGLAEFYRNPIQAWGRISQQSAHMRSTDETRARDLTHQIKSLTLEGPAAWREARRVHASIQRHAFVFQETSFRLTAGPLWLARQGQEIAAGGTETAATEAADALIRRLFPAHGAVNQPGVSRNKYLAPFVQFYSFFSSVVNKNLDEWQRVLEAPGGEAKIRAAIRATAFVTTLGLLGGIIHGRGPKQDEEPEEWALWAMLSFTMAQVPFGGDVSQVLEATGKGRPAMVRPGLVGSGVMAFAEGLKAMDSERDGGDRARSALKAAGPLVGVPSSAVTRTGRYVAGAVEGDEGTSPADVVSGTIFGPTREGDSDLLRDFWAWLNE